MGEACIFPLRELIINGFEISQLYSERDSKFRNMASSRPEFEPNKAGA